MDKLLLTGQNLGQVFNIRSGHLHTHAFLVSSLKLPNLQLKTQPKQLLGYLPFRYRAPLKFNTFDCADVATLKTFGNVADFDGEGAKPVAEPSSLDPHRERGVAWPEAR
jgi:hypothetical protein